MFYVYGSFNMTVKNIIFEKNGESNCANFLALNSDTSFPFIVIENNYFYAQCNDDSETQTFIATNGNARIMGNFFKLTGPKAVDNRAIETSGTIQLISSNYFEGDFINCIFITKGYPNGVSGYIRNNQLYNDTEIVSIVGFDFQQSGLILSDNTDNSVSPSEFPNYTGNYAGVHSGITPTIGSALIDAGYAESGWTTDIFGTSRGASPDVGAAEYVPASVPINTFNTTPLRNGAPVTSTINTSELVIKIQADNPDTYLDSTSEVAIVDMFYTHIDGRQKKRIKHSLDGTNLQGVVSWSTNARDGTWEVTRIKAFDNDGAEHSLNRSAIGSDSDVVLS
jgi:hypothetical protein